MNKAMGTRFLLFNIKTLLALDSIQSYIQILV